MPGAIEATTAAIIELRTIARRPKPDSSLASANAWAAATRVVSRPRVACRGSTNSLSDMIAFDQWIAPMPMASSARAMPRPMKRLLSRIATIEPSSIGNRKYAAIAQMLAATER